MNKITVLGGENIEGKRTTKGKLRPSDRLDGLKGRGDSDVEPGGEVA